MAEKENNTFNINDQAHSYICEAFDYLPGDEYLEVD
jgi:hypothetical protein